MQLPSGPVEDQLLEGLIDLGDKVGNGTTRDVFGVKDDPDFVIKVSFQPFQYGNFVEWTVWHAVQKMAEDIMGNETNSNLWELFARTISISHSAKFLLMERLKPVTEVDPTGLRNFPYWLNDRKPSSFGMDKNGQIKVVDYAMVDFYYVLNPLNRSHQF